MRWLRKHRYTIFLITIGCFLVGTFMGFGSYFFTQSPYDAAILVNDQKISYKRFQSRFQQYLHNRQDKEPLTQQKTDQLRQEAVQDLVREAVFLQEAEKYGIEVTDNELAAYIQRMPAFQKDGQFDQGLYFQVTHQVLRIPPEEFEEDRRNDIKIQKMQALMASAVKVSPFEASLRFEKEKTGSPNDLREKMRQEQVNGAFQEWLTQINNQLKVKVMLEKFEGKREG